MKDKRKFTIPSANSGSLVNLPTRLFFISSLIAVYKAPFSPPKKVFSFIFNKSKSVVTIGPDSRFFHLHILE